MLRILKLHLYLFILCQAAETSTDRVTDLGQNVTINCDLDDAKEVTWLLLNLPNPPVVILHSFLNPPTAFYYKHTFRHKYSVKSAHHLFINNITIEELGVYYCMDTDTTVKFSDGTRLHIIYSSQPTESTVNPQCQNRTVVEQHDDEEPTWWQIVTLIFGLFSAILVIGLIALLVMIKCFC
ncbi:hypothetical protein R3I93_017376 [Phoxinus phoxinus]|uniref:Immunoglobulin domain-containing protein n=1 Tax=Phoxinus phoxinus TaxID=58324 RepID=A0AAN9CNG8_9TELE